MSDLGQQSLAVLRRIAEFIEFLPQDQVDDLANGRARLTLIPSGSQSPLVPVPTRPVRTPKQPKPVKDTAEIVAALDAASSREEAVARLEPLAAGDLRAVAASLGLTGVAKTPKPVLTGMIVDFTVGARLSAAAIRAM